MATTLIENIVNELTELVAQKVLEEFNRRTDEVTARLNALELERFDLVHRADLCSNFVTRDDLLVDEALIKEAVEDWLQHTGFIDEEDLQRHLDQYRFVTEDDLIEFINDRVRITVE